MSWLAQEHMSSEQWQRPDSSQVPNCAAAQAKRILVAGSWMGSSPSRKNISHTLFKESSSSQYSMKDIDPRSILWKVESTWISPWLGTN